MRKLFRLGAFVRAATRHLRSLVTDHDLAYRKAPSLYSLEYLRSDRVLEMQSKAPDAEGYVPARPEGYFSIRQRLKVAWEVFTGRADAVRWPQNQ